jgi:heme/copper-type cytochrome/quinol oxidase subunit 1
MRTQAWIGIALLKIASLYLLAGLVLGLAMGVAQDFSLVSVHTHILLIGWATLALTGIVYLIVPSCAQARLATAHFWLHNLGLPVMLASLVLAARSEMRAEPVIAVGSMIVLLALALFTLNVLLNAKSSDAGSAPSA